MGNSKSKKNRETLTIDSRNICCKAVMLLYFSVVFSIYPILIDDKYFNVTITKTRFILTATAIFVVGYGLALIVDTTIKKYYGIKDDFLFYKEERYYIRPGYWMELFILANLFAMFQANENSGVFYGENGRYMGMLTYLIIGLMFILVCMRGFVNDIPVVIFAAATLYIYVIGIIQHLELDIRHYTSCVKKSCALQVLHYRQGLGEKQFDIFMSTLGNINIFASFIVISLALFFGLFIFTDKRYLKIISGILLVFGGATVMIANSDSGYLGMAAAGYLLFLLAIKWGRVRQFIISLLLLACGNLGIVLLNKYAVEDYDKRGGVAEALDSIGVALAIMILFAILYVAVYYLQKRFKSFIEGLNKNKVIAGIIIFTIIVGIVVIWIGNAKGIGLFTFNYKWGTYRGFIWTKCVELFCDGDLSNKLFGYGNECLSEQLQASCRQEMLDVTGKLYDNAHNELLQYLVTLGIFGLVTYLGVFISSFSYIIKYGKNNPYTVAVLACITGYFVQGLINLNQPITTPLYFVIMAMGVGYVRSMREKAELDD